MESLPFLSLSPTIVSLFCSVSSGNYLENLNDCFQKPMYYLTACDIPANDKMLLYVVSVGHITFHGCFFVDKFEYSWEVTFLNIF